MPDFSADDVMAFLAPILRTDQMAGVLIAALIAWEMGPVLPAMNAGKFVRAQSASFRSRSQATFPGAYLSNKEPAW